MSLISFDLNVRTRANSYRRKITPRGVGKKPSIDNPNMDRFLRPVYVVYVIL